MNYEEMVALLDRLESLYCTEGDYCEDDHPVAVAMERLMGECIRLGTQVKAMRSTYAPTLK